MSDKKPNKVYLALRKIYCLRGAEFCRTELEMGWKEIEKLQAKNEALVEAIKKFKSNPITKNKHAMFDLVGDER